MSAAQLGDGVLEQGRLFPEAVYAGLAEANALRSALLQAVSHDLPTPLAAIKASSSSLVTSDVDWSPEDVASFARTIDEQADRLICLVENLLQISRIQACWPRYASRQATDSTSFRRSQEGRSDMTQLLVGTKKGLLAGRGARCALQVSSRAFAGEPVEFAFRDPRTGRNFACLTSAFYGPKLFYTDDLAAEWQQAEGIELPEDAEKAMTRLWVVTPGEEDGLLYAGGDPGVLFESRDGGKTWELNKAFWEQPTRPDWSPEPAACACTRSRLAR